MFKLGPGYNNNNNIKNNLNPDLSRSEEEPVLNDGEYAGYFPAQVVLFALEGPVWAQDHRGKRVPCTNVHNALNDRKIPAQVVLFGTCM